MKKFSYNIRNTNNNHYFALVIKILCSSVLILSSWRNSCAATSERLVTFEVYKVDRMLEWNCNTPNFEVLNKKQQEFLIQMAHADFECDNQQRLL